MTHDPTIKLTVLVNADEARLSTKLRVAHNSPVDTSGGPHDPRTRQKLDDLYHWALVAGWCTDREAFLMLAGLILARLLPDRSLAEPALTLSNLAFIERALHLDEDPPAILTQWRKCP